MQRITFLIFILLALSSCQEQSQELTASVEHTSKEGSPKDPNLYDLETIYKYLDDGKMKDWIKEKDPKMVYSIGYYTDFSYIVGYTRGW